jgi:hypothetical protein
MADYFTHKFRFLGYRRPSSFKLDERFFLTEYLIDWSYQCHFLVENY